MGRVSKEYEFAVIIPLYFFLCPSAIYFSGSHNPLQRRRKKVGGFVCVREKGF